MNSFNSDESATGQFRRRTRRIGRMAVAEASGVATDMASLAMAAPFLTQSPRGDGHSVLVMPGFGAGDGSTRVLRGFLRGLGHQSQPWNLGRNLGPGTGDLRLELAERLRSIFADGGDRKVSLVGWSLGGVYARALAQRYPQLVRQVITLGSPIGSRLTGGGAGPAATPTVRPLPGVPSTAIFSKSDRIVPWHAAVQAVSGIAENVEVYASHSGLGFNPSVLYAVADRLALPESDWRHFERRGWKQSVYGAANLQVATPSRQAGGR